MASVDRRGSGYRVRYRDPDGRSRNRTFTKLKAAKDFAATVEVSKLKGQFVDPAESAKTFKVVAEEWWTVHSPTFADSTRTLWRRYLDRYILPKIGAYPIGKIKRSTMDAAMTSWRQMLAPRTVRNVLTLTRRILASAVADQIIGANPADGIKPPKAPARRDVNLSDQDVKAIIAAAPDAHHALVITLAGLGLRISEACGLRLEDVDFLHRVVHVRQQRRPDGSYGKLKTDESPREIPASDAVLQAISEQIRRYPRDDGLIFSAAFGRTLTRSAAGHVFVKIADETKISVSPHSLRHYFGASLLTRGVNAVAVSRWLGHANPSITLNVYSYLMKNDEDTGRTAINAVMGTVLAETAAARVQSVSTRGSAPAL